MPPRADAVLLLSVDHDPVDDRLAAIGYAHYREGARVREVVQVPATGSAVDEAATIEMVLGQLVSDLLGIDAANQAGGEIHAHIFLYEPSEAVQLQEAVGRHLDDPRIRGGLLHLVRLFPPEDIVPEPEFRGAHHLPATAVRTVIEQLYALPTQVSYDLRQVSHALATVGAITDPYVPEEAFERPFSSLLSIEVIRGLREGRPNAPGQEQVVADVSARLRALHQVITWLFAQNAASSQPLLRLAKRPFRLHATFDPLNAEDLDLLLACEILESRAGLLEALIGLAQPTRRRRDAGRAMTGLSVVRHWVERGRRQIIFRVPPESRETDLAPGAFNLILTDDDPDLRLDPTAWPAIGCRFEPPRLGFEDRVDQIRVSMAESDFVGTTFRTMFDRSLTQMIWCLDRSLRRHQWSPRGAVLGRPRAGARMSVHTELLRFLRETARFAAAADDPQVWLGALETFVEPALARPGQYPLRRAQLVAWRGLANARAGLVMGPPGTGKTHLLAWLILGYMHSRVAPPGCPAGST